MTSLEFQAIIEKNRHHFEKIGFYAVMGSVLAEILPDFLAVCEGLSDLMLKEAKRDIEFNL